MMEESPFSTLRIYSRELIKNGKQSYNFAANFFADQSHYRISDFASHRANKFA